MLIVWAAWLWICGLFLRLDFSVWVGAKVGCWVCFRWVFVWGLGLVGFWVVFLDFILGVGVWVCLRVRLGYYSLGRSGLGFHEVVGFWGFGFYFGRETLGPP